MIFRSILEKRRILFFLLGNWQKEEINIEYKGAAL